MRSMAEVRLRNDLRKLPVEARLKLMASMINEIDDPEQARRLIALAQGALVRGQRLLDQVPPRRSDGSVISPYAPDGGPIGGMS